MSGNPWTADPGDDAVMRATGAGLDAMRASLEADGLELRYAMVVAVLADGQMATCAPAMQSPLETLDVALNVAEGLGVANITVLPLGKPFGGQG